MKISSITDVISNSSTEVFPRVTRETIDDLKEIINLILELGGSDKTCDDFFKFSLDPSRGEWVYCDQMDEDSKPWEELTEEEKIDFMISYADNKDDGWLRYPDVRIIPKSPDIPKKLISYLNSISYEGINSLTTRYC